MMRLHEQSADREIDAAATRVQVDMYVLQPQAQQ